MDTPLVPSPRLFKAVIHADAYGGYWAEVADLPGCFTQGDTLDDVYRLLREEIARHLEVQSASVRIGLLEMDA